jgi:hypothetical protein
MTYPILIAYTCPSCASVRATILQDGATVRCCGCNRDHGFLSEVRRALRDNARLDAAQKAKRVFAARRGGGRLA